MATVGHAQRAGQPDHTVSANEGGIEAVEIDAWRNRLETALECGKALQGVARDMLGHGDDCIGAHLATLDEPPGDAACDERRMQGGDPLDLEPARQCARHPRRAGRSRLDHRHARLAQARGEPGGEGEALPQWVHGLGQFEMRGAQPQQVGHHGATRRGHDGRTARRDHGLRRVERGARQPAAGEGGDDLQECIGAGTSAWRRVRCCGR